MQPLNATASTSAAHSSFYNSDVSLGASSSTAAAAAHRLPVQLAANNRVTNSKTTITVSSVTTTSRGAKVVVVNEDGSSPNECILPDANDGNAAMTEIKTEKDDDVIASA